MEHSPPVELSPQETMTLIRIANEGDIGAGNSDEGTVARLQSLGLVEQWGVSLRSDIEGHAKRSPAQAKLAADVRTPLRQAVRISEADRERSISPFVLSATLRRSARPYVPAACLSHPWRTTHPRSTALEMVAADFAQPVHRRPLHRLSVSRPRRACRRSTARPRRPRRGLL